MRKAAALFKRGACIGSIGRSEKGRTIPFIRVGSCREANIIMTGGIHAREYVTAELVLRQAEYAVNHPIDNWSVYFIPCVNPDGMEICLGKDSAPEWYDGDPGLYKANSLGVDLNVNFDAGWGSGKHNMFRRAGENYVGEFPLCASETRALRDFTLGVKPCSTVSYHTKGREIYYDYNLPDRLRRRTKKLADAINEKLRYEISDQAGSAGGYKDWCEEKLRIPAFTIELGSDSAVHPLKRKDIKEDIARNIDLPQVLCTCLTTIKN